MLDSKTIRFLSPDDLDILWNTVKHQAEILPEWFPRAIRLNIATGCRPAELFGRTGRVNREPEEGYAPQSAVKEHHGLRGRDVLPDDMLQVFGKNTRRASSLKPRVVVCADPSLHRELLALARRVPPDDHLFGLGPNREQPQGDGYGRYIRAIRKLRLHLPPHLRGFSPRWLRHTWAVHALRNRVDLVSVQRQLGHEHLATTAIYLRFAPMDKEQIVRAFSRGLDSHVEKRDCPACGFMWQVDTRTGAIDTSDRVGAILRRR